MEVDYKILIKLYKEKGGKIILTKTSCKFNNYFCNVDSNNRYKIFIKLNKIKKVLDWWWHPFNKFSYYKFNKEGIITDIKSSFFYFELTTIESRFIPFIFSKTTTKIMRSRCNYLIKFLLILSFIFWMTNFL
jgi:hypothetical protein